MPTPEYNNPPWIPMSDTRDLRVTGKTLEELGELVQCLSRCLIQGIDSAEPVTGVINRQWLESEVADTIATVTLLIQHFKLNEAIIDARAASKMAKLIPWQMAL